MQFYNQIMEMWETFKSILVRSNVEYVSVLMFVCHLNDFNYLKFIQTMGITLDKKEDLEATIWDNTNEYASIETYNL
jgi:hypothetical protein